MKRKMEEKFYPIRINPNLCVRCQKCSYSCNPKAIFWSDSLRYVNYEKCKGCLKCVEVCEHGAIEVISLIDSKLMSFKINKELCNLCQSCLKKDFCFENLFKLNINNEGKKEIKFQHDKMEKCSKCFKCFLGCPNNAILPDFKK